MPALRSWARFLAGYAELVCLAASAGLLLSFLEPVWYMADIFSQLRLQGVIALLVSGALLALAGKRRWAWGNAAALGLGLLLVIPPLFRTAPSAARDESPRLRIWMQNVHSSNRQYDRVLASIREADPDVILVLEVTAGWRQALAVLENDYPYHLIEAREDNFGIAFFSRVPVAESRVVDFSGYDVPSVQAALNWAGRSVEFIGTHPVPAAGPAQFRVRNWQLRDLARETATSPRPVVVAGDFNLSPFSRTYATLLREGGLRPAGVPWRFTWNPRRLPLMGVRIDYVLVSEEWAVARSEVGRFHGSDHRALVTELVLRR